MAIHELNEEQIHSWSLEEKDRWWLKNVFRGNMPQLTIRSALTGMLLGSVMALTNLYVGAKTGWTMGVGITSVILAYALFKVMSRIGLAEEFTVLENNAMQSIATAAGYMTSPLISSLAAYMMATRTIIPLWQTFLWMTILAVLGVLFAFPFKRRFINDEQQPFPEGRAAGVVMDSLHHGEAASSMLKAKLLVLAAAVAAFVKLIQSATIMGWMKLWYLVDDPDVWLYKYFGYDPRLGRTPLADLTIKTELDLVMVGAGGLMGIRTGVSLLIGATINFVILAPIMVERGDIKLLEITWPFKEPHVDFKAITFWSLWCGVAMMTVASILSFFAKPKILLSAFSKLFTRSQQSSDVLGHIELPLSVSFIGIPIVGAAVVVMAKAFFGVEIWLSVVAILLVFVFCLIAINSTGLTSITPIGAMGKLTQLTFAVLAPKNIGTNLATAGIAGEVASHSANLISDIKPGYMLGAKPRQQAMGHILGILAGSVLSIPVFYLVFLNLNTEQAFATTALTDHKVTFPETYPMPSASIWKLVSDVLTQGIEKIPPTARIAALAGLIVGLILELLRMVTKDRFPLSPIALGLGFIIHFHTSFMMFLGAFIFWLAEKIWADKRSTMNQVVVQNQEPICGGLVAGGALMGIIVAVVDVLAKAK